MKALIAAIVCLALHAPGGPNVAPQTAVARPAAAVFVAYYWKARPDRIQEYNEYIRTIAEPIDEDARRAGVFEEVRTVTPVASADGQLPEWTHLRIFRVASLEAAAGLGAGLDAATSRVVPDSAQRKANTGRASELRVLMRREVWTELR